MSTELFHSVCVYVCRFSFKLKSSFLYLFESHSSGQITLKTEMHYLELLKIFVQMLFCVIKVLRNIKMGLNCIMDAFVGPDWN